MMLQEGERAGTASQMAIPHMELWEAHPVASLYTTSSGRSAVASEEEEVAVQLAVGVADTQVWWSNLILMYLTCRS